MKKKQETDSTKIVFVQGVITQHDLGRLKEKTGENATKDAVNAALEYYLNGA